MGGGAPSGRGDGRRPALAEAAALGLLLFVVFVANGRPIVAGDTRPTERVAASLVTEGDLDLDEYPEVRGPFTRKVGEHYVSIYPVLSAVLATPVFAVAARLFPLDEHGTALAGKLSAALFSSLACAIFFLAVGRRRTRREAFWAALLLGLGTSVWSTSQALWQHPAAVMFVCLALLFVVKAEEDPVWAGRAGLPLALVVVARHADIALAAVLGAAVAVRWPRRIPWVVGWALPPACLLMAYQWVYFGSPLRHGFSGSLGRFSAPWGEGHLGLLLSPGKGLLLFTPVVLLGLLGMANAWRHGERWLAGTLAAAAGAHWLLMGRWSEWHGGECWGPRMMTDTMPLLLFFLPEGLARAPRLGTVLAAISVGVQALGAFAYDGRWERLYQSPPERHHEELWRVASAPVPFFLGQGVYILALPWLRQDRVVFLEHRVAVFSAAGSRIDVSETGPKVGGEAPLFGDVHLLRGARAHEGWLRFRGRWDGLFLRVRTQGRQQPFVLVVEGRGEGYLYVGETSFFDKTRWSTYPMDGAFRIVHPYDYADAGGADLIVTIGRARGWADVRAVELQPHRPPARLP